MVRLVGYDTEKEKIGICYDGKLLWRELSDLQHWDRWLHSHLKKLGRNFERIPTKRLKKLVQNSWSMDEVTEGKRPEMTKSIAVCNKWLSSLIELLPGEEAQSFLNDEIYMNKKEATVARLKAQKAAKDYGQFFSSTSSIEKVCECLQKLYSAQEIESSVFLEPSCGDGRFFQHIQSIRGQKIIAMEIDASVAGLARKSAVGLSNLSVEITIADFLSSSRQIDTESNLIVVGNPPFSNSHNPHDDIAYQFIQHCAVEWCANTIAFILPDRCLKPDYTAKVLADLNLHGHEWKLAESVHEPQSSFDFLGTKKIQKPSVIQIYHRFQ
ncbi:hypothetical protein THRCLA_01483 [Thraustotheca clavata]|uniref:DNA methylase adenine-specific domain-containing protein n=1 Tax=Thraustotheca clavata TaxID=74557 RepID=A0A1W0A8C3_9STRA|nr:hypothetical protein THRCLA_01483 [Thraustotheca clavata]